MSISGAWNGCAQDTDIFPQDARWSGGDYVLTSRSRVDSDVTFSAAGDIGDLNLPLKHASCYSFSFDVIYSTTGLVLCGAQFAVTFGGTVTSIGYAVTLVTVGNTVVSAGTTTAGTFLGSGATVAAGGPRTARVFGSIKTGATGGWLTLRCQPSGLSTSVIVAANSCGKAEEQ